MVIFHSYVRLPEGNMIVGGENSPKPTLAAVFSPKISGLQRASWSIPVTPKKTSMPWSNGLNGLNMFKLDQKHKKKENKQQRNICNDYHMMQ